MFEQQQNNIPAWDVATYPAIDAARLAKLSPERVRRWLRGYQYQYSPVDGKSQVRTQKPVVRRKANAIDTYASFLDLIDLLYVKRFLDNRISLQKIRKALDEAAYRLGTNHFARETFFTSNKKIYLEVRDQDNPIIELLAGGQYVIGPIIRELSQRIEFDGKTGLARRWYPLGQEKRVVVDPQMSFGRPTVAGKGVPTATIHDFYCAEHRRVGRVCEWFKMDRDAVMAAVEFEEGLIKAA